MTTERASVVAAAQLAREAQERRGLRVRRRRRPLALPPAQPAPDQPDGAAP